MSDLIDRQAAIYEILEWKTRMTKQGLADRIAMLPTVQLERKKGKWHKQDNGQIYWYECSVCGCEPLRNKWNGDWEFSDFCPNCGCQMMRGDSKNKKGIYE